MTFKLRLPFDGTYNITQTYAGHVARAQQMGCCIKPGQNCKCFYYPAIDYGTPSGTPIMAAAEGKVATLRKDTHGYGIHVRLVHDTQEAQYLTVYAHLSNYAILEVGEHVNRGDTIGWSGKTGNSSGDHLHFELRKNGIPVDPAPYLQAGPVEPPVEPPSPPGYGDYYQVIVPALRIREYAGTNHAIMGVLYRDATIEANDYDDSIPGEVWVGFGLNLYCAAEYHGQKYIERV